MFEGFRSAPVELGDIRINAKVGGSGPPLLLLHGYPQTHTIWHRVVPYLVEHFTVVVSDLRGYGDSSKPVGLPDHSNYSKRVMAQDQLNLMTQLGFDSFYLAGHDRGGRVAHRLALDHPQRVKKLALLDISPTLKMYQQTDMTFASAYYHWFFLIQPVPFPETLIGAAPQTYLEKKMTLGSAGKTPFAPEAWAEYVRCFTPQTIHASCEDYRAAATIDLDHDRESIAKGHKIQCPLLVLWGQHGVIERCFKPLEDWVEVAADVRGKALPGGHYLAEELPQQTSSELIQFFKENP